MVTAIILFLLTSFVSKNLLETRLETTKTVLGLILYLGVCLLILALFEEGEEGKERRSTVMIRNWGAGLSIFASMTMIVIKIMEPYIIILEVMVSFSLSLLGMTVKYSVIPSQGKMPTWLRWIWWLIWFQVQREHLIHHNCENEMFFLYTNNNQLKDKKIRKFYTRLFKSEKNKAWHRKRK